MRRSPIPEVELRRFAMLAAPFLQGASACGYGPRAAMNKAGRGLEFLDTRRYEPGDDFRSIDWQQSARSNNLVIRRYQEDTAADWFICVDRSASVAWGNHKWPMTQRLTAALAYTLLHAGHRVGILFWSDRVHDSCSLGRGAHHFAGLLQTLLRHQPASASQAKEHTSSNLGVCRSMVKANSNVFVLSDFLEAGGMHRDLRAINARAASVNAIQVLDTAETQIPVRGSTALQDAESGVEHRVVMNEQTEEHAEAALLSNSQALDKTCRRLNIRVSTCQTEQRWETVLLDHLRPRG